MLCTTHEFSVAINTLAAVKALRSGWFPGIVNPQWTAEGDVSNVHWHIIHGHLLPIKLLSCHGFASVVLPSIDSSAVVLALHALVSLLHHNPCMAPKSSASDSPDTVSMGPYDLVLTFPRLVLNFPHRRGVR